MAWSDGSGEDEAAASDSAVVAPPPPTTPSPESYRARLACVHAHELSYRALGNRCDVNAPGCATVHYIKSVHYITLHYIITFIALGAT